MQNSRMPPLRCIETRPWSKAQLKKLFSYIEVERILNFELAGVPFFYKLAWIHLYKQYDFPYQVAYIDEIDYYRKVVYFHYFSYDDKICKVEINECNVTPKLIEKKEYTFVNKLFINEYIFELPLGENAKNLTIQIDGLVTYFDAHGTEYVNTIVLKNIKIKRTRKIKKYMKNAISKWIIS